MGDEHDRCCRPCVGNLRDSPRDIPVGIRRFAVVRDVHDHHVALLIAEQIRQSSPGNGPGQRAVDEDVRAGDHCARLSSRERP